MGRSRALPRGTNDRSPSVLTPTRYGASETIALFCARDVAAALGLEGAGEHVEAIGAADEALQIEREAGVALRRR